ncbi:MAG: RsmB/NOP family class I SAM-dependent RNA methyltransferase [Micavibrio sp.]|nr:RsmB/NOP family class I SAM-dependent RNA methyltransferase [Micavibrio sp.]
MKPSSRIQANIEILERAAAQSRIPMDSVVGDYMRQRRYIGSKDRNEIADRAYNIIRNYAKLTWWIKHEKGAITARAYVIYYLLLGEGLDAKRVRDLFDGTKYSADPLSDEEEKILTNAGKKIEHPEMPLTVKVECPAESEEHLKAVFGDDFEAELLAMLNPAPLDLRVNTFIMPRENAADSLKKDGIETKETPLSPCGLRCLDKAYLSKTKAFNKGWVEIQDEGSQMIAHLCKAAPGMQVLDFCAGGGGKTLALAAAMQRKGRIVALDNSTRRLERGKRRYKKAQISDIVEVRSLEDEKNRKWLKRQKEKFDIVLTDVPCSGSGTWRRNPDMRWTNYGPSLDELLPIQAEILEKAASCVKNGGRLVYATCSLYKQENEAQIEAFLGNHPEFEVEAVPNELGTAFMRLTPHRHNTDGFFAAVLVKKSS